MAKLLGKADSTLVQAATSAAMAGVPANLSRVHERMARSHRRTMESLGRSFKEVTSAAVKVGGELIKTARKNKKNNRLDYKNDTDYQTKPSNLEKEMPGPKIGGVGQTKFSDLSDVSLEKSKPTLTEKKEFGEVTKEFKDDAKQYSITNANGNEEVITTKTIPEQLEDIRKQKLSISLFGDKREEFTKEERKLKREELNMLRDNLRASALEFKTFENTATALIESDSFNSKATGEVKQNFLRALLNKGEPIGGDGPFAGSRAIMGFDKKGKMSFVYVDKYGDPILDRNSKPLSVQQSGVDELLVPKSAAREVYKVNVKAQIQQGANNLPYNRAFSDSNLELTLRTKNDVLDIFYHQGQSHEQSIAEALHGVKSLADGTTQLEPSMLSAKVFGELNPENWDNSGDGVIDKQDFATEGNYKKLVDYILSGEDLDLSKQVIKNYAASQEQKYHQQGLDKYNEAQNKILEKKKQEKADEFNVMSVFPPATVYGNIKKGDGTQTSITGDTFISLYNRFQSGTLKTSNDEYNFNKKYKYWENKNGDRYSGTQMLNMFQPPAGPQLSTSTPFSIFRGDLTETATFINTPFDR